MKRNKLALFLVGAIFIFTSNGKWIIPVSIWISLFCFLRFSRLNKPWIGFISILLIGFLSNIFIWKGLIPLPSPLYLIVSFIGSMFFSIPFLIERLLIKRITNYSQSLIYPALFTFFSYLYTLISPSGTFGSIAYSQSNILLIQTVSVTGIWGIIFILGWTAATINYLIDNYRIKQRIYFPLIIYSTIIVSVLIYGIIRISDPNTKETVKIAGIINEHNFNKSIKENLDDFIVSSKNNADLLFTKTKTSVQNGAKVIFWQETAHIVLNSFEDSLIMRAQGFAQENGIYLGMSIFSLSKDYLSKPAENKIIWITPEGKTGMEFFKAYPTPAEMIVRGNMQPKVIDSKYGNLSSAICFDMNFPGFIRKYGKKDIDLLCVPANDWKEITPYHANISAFRGIENGFSIVRATGNGLSVAFNGNGRLLSKLNYFNSQERIIYAEVPIQRINTLYTYVGDFLPWLSILAVIIITTLSLTKKKIQKDQNG